MSARARTALLAGVGFLLLQLGWVLSIAPDFGIDEFDHVYRASSVAAGHWQAGNDPLTGKIGRGDLIPVRADVAKTASGACRSRPYTGVYNCKPKETLGNGEVLIASAAARYNPTFYAIVGTVAKPFHGEANLIVLRLATAVLAGTLFLLVIWLTLAGARTIWPLMAVLTAALPTTIYSTAVASPNGVEMIAGLGVWVALTAVVAPHGEQRRGPSYALLALFAAFLANMHSLGLVWLALIAVSVAVVHGLVNTVRSLLPRARAELAAALLAALSCLFEIGWILTSGANDPSAESMQFHGSPIPSVVQGIVLWPLQAIGAFPMRNEHAPLLVYGMLAAVLLGLVVFALRTSGLRSRTAAGLAFITVVSFVVPACLTISSFHELGAAWQGRYGMPFTVGLLAIMGGQLDLSTSRVLRSRTLALGVVVLLVVAELISQVSVMTKQRSISALVEITHWDPPAIWILVALSAAALVCWLQAATWKPTGVAEEATTPARAQQEIVLA